MTLEEAKRIRRNYIIAVFILVLLLVACVAVWIRDLFAPHQHIVALTVLSAPIVPLLVALAVAISPLRGILKNPARA